MNFEASLMRRLHQCDSERAQREGERDEANKVGHTSRALSESSFAVALVTCECPLWSGAGPGHQPRIPHQCTNLGAGVAVHLCAKIKFIYFFMWLAPVKCMPTVDKEHLFPTVDSG